MKKLIPAAPLAAGLVLLGGGLTARAQTAFTPGDLVIYRVGNGTETLASTGNTVFLDEYTPTGTLKQSIQINNGTTGAGGNDLISSGTATSEGELSLSPDGQYLALTGYDTATGGTASLSGTAAATVNRTVDIFGANGAIKSSTALSDFADGNNPRGAVPTSGGANFYATGGAGGVRYGTVGATTSVQLSTTNLNLRGVVIAGGQLYVSTQSGTNTFGLGAVGTGTPTTSGQTITGLLGLPNQAKATFAPNQFAFADLSSTVPGVDTLYVADENSTAGGTIDKFSLVGGNWTANGTITAANVRGLTLQVVGGTVNLFATTGGSTATGGGTLYGFADTTGYNATVSGAANTLATAAANESFRGIAFAPTLAAAPEPSTWMMLALGGAGLLAWMRRRAARAVG